MSAIALAACGGSDAPSGLPLAAQNSAANNSAATLVGNGALLNQASLQEAEAQAAGRPKPAQPSAATAAWQQEGARLYTAELNAIAETGEWPKAFDGPLLSGAEGSTPATLDTHSSAQSANLQKAAHTPPSPRVPVHRLYNSSTSAHFLTTSNTERDNVTNTLPAFSDEGQAFHTSNKQRDSPGSHGALMHSQAVAAASCAPAPSLHAARPRLAPDTGPDPSLFLALHRVQANKDTSKTRSCVQSGTPGPWSCTDHSKSAPSSRIHAFGCEKMAHLPLIDQAQPTGQIIWSLKNGGNMTKKTYLISILVAAFCSSALLSSCTGEEGETGQNADGGGVGKSAEKGGGKTYKMKDLMAISQEVKAYKKEIGYETPAEARKLDQKALADVQRLAKLKMNHPTLKKIEEEGADAKAKLMKAVADNDEAAKQKWGPIAAGSIQKKMAALEEIPEIVELQKMIDADSAKSEQLNYDELAKTAKGKELADKQREIVKGFLGK